MSEIQIPVRKFIRLLDYLDVIGLDCEKIANSVQLSCRQLKKLPVDEALPAKQYSLLYKEAVVQMQTLNRPIPWAAGIGTEAFELMCHCIIGARTLGEALVLAGRFDKLLYPLLGYRVESSVEGLSARVSYHIAGAESDPVFVPDNWAWVQNHSTISRASGLLVWYALCGWLIGRSIEPTEVRISAPFLNQEYADSLFQVFHCPIYYDADETVLVFPADTMDYRLVHTSESLEDFLANAIYQLIASDKKPASTSGAIKSLIGIDLTRGIPSFSAIAESLHMSESSLRRRLLKEDTNYQALKDEIRCEVAIEKLRQGDVKINDIAEYLGFTEASSFVRSFRAWTGYTPKTYREKLQSLGSTPGES